MIKSNLRNRGEMKKDKSKNKFRMRFDRTCSITRGSKSNLLLITLNKYKDRCKT